MTETNFNYKEIRRLRQLEAEREEQMKELRKRSKQQLLIDLHIMCVAERAAENYNRRKI